MKKIIPFVVMVLAGAPASTIVWAQTAPKGDPANGKKIYLAAGCYQCHGRVGQGGLMTGPAPILAQTKMPYPAFTRQLRNPINDMPPYPANLLADQEIADIYAFLQSLPGRRAVKDIPILDKN
ncbi:MAG TPA: cytochrome c [Rhizomicrobium sp.]|nr:cytochrome c [Rhizomicrobium sp.]